MITVNFAEAMRALLEGKVVQDDEEFYYKIQDGALYDSTDCALWQPCEEFTFGVINMPWRIRGE